jgi:S1-C subfamily serine protease
VEFSGKPVPNFQAFRALMLPLKPGQKVGAKVLRDQKTLEITVELGEWK